MQEMPFWNATAFRKIESASVTVSGSQVLLSDAMSETYSDHLCGPPGQFTLGQRLMYKTEISSS